MSARRPFFNAPETAVWRRQADELKLRMLAWWKERSARERRLLAAGAAVIGAALIWTQVLQPALDTIALSRELLPRLRAQAAQVDALILEARALQRGQSARIDPAELSEALRAGLRRAGLEASAALSEISEANHDKAAGQWEVALHDANATRVMEWLAGLPHLGPLHARIVDLKRANIDGRDRPGHVSGRIVLQAAARQTP